MAVLSDKTIKKEISEGRLILGGDPTNARHCGYEFKAGRVTYGGTTDGKARVIDLVSGPEKSATISPSAIAWIRSEAKVQIPPNKVGVWIQTNSLSRRGLMLLNSTLVEPGYEGYLAAHLVNLGAQPATLGPDDTIAKLVFLELDDTAEELVSGKKYERYDTFIEQLAASSTSSFLSINEFADLGVKKLVQSAEEEAREKVRTVLESFGRAQILKVFGAYAVGFLLSLGFLAWAMPKLRTIDAESEARISEIVKKQAESHSKELKALQSELNEMRTQLVSKVKDSEGE